MKLMASWFLIILLSCLISIQQIVTTPLDDYVNTPDPHFSWRLIETYNQPDYKLFIINMTSQKWFDETITNHPIWWHYVCITVPTNIKRPDSALLFIDGGHNTDPIPQPQDKTLTFISGFAVSSGSFGVYLQDIPNQSFRFLADPSNRSRSEDALIAWTWRTFLDDPSNPYILLRMPMTKGVVRTMDVVQKFAEEMGFPVPKTFVVAGASKRGWTTWTTAAVDNNRVIGAVPIVMDMLNLQQNLHHHFRSLNGWTFAFSDYYELNITQYVDHPNMKKMADIVDPYSYFDRYRNTKILQIQTSGDEFFLPDNEDAFWNDLQVATGGSFIRRIPNAEHSCTGHETSLFFTMLSFYLSVYDKAPLPSFKWMKTSNQTHGYIQATIDYSVGPKPIKVVGYRARTLSKNRRDFRLAIADPNNPGKAKLNPVIWFTQSVKTELETPSTIVYSLTIERPLTGWEGFYIEATFPGVQSTNIQLTTETQIIRDTYPASDCHGTSCMGTLV